MRALNIFTIFLLISNITFSQNWKTNLPNKDKSKLTFYNYQDAFNKYWNTYNVIDGKYIDSDGIEKKAIGWKQFKRWEYFWSSRVDIKTGDFPKKKMFDEYKTYEKQFSANKSKSTWASLGPNSTVGGYYGLGRVSTIAFHPTDNNIFWIGAPAGGLWVTTLGGDNWMPLTENNEVLGISAIIIPSDYATSETIYIGTGDRDAFDNNSIGVLKSTDAGVSWQATGLVFTPENGEVVNAMLIHPSDNNKIFASTSDGFYISSDAGTIWNKTSTLEFIDIEFNPGNPEIIYASSRNGRVYKSVDAGNNWLQILYSGVGNRIEIAVSENAPERLYVMAANSQQGLEGIWRSDDSGEHFSQLPNTGSLMNWSTDGTGENKGQAWYDMAFDVDPTNADILYLGGVNTWKSVDAGNNWTLSNHWYGGGGAAEVHADKHFFKFKPGTSTLFECNDGGIYKTSNGVSWEHLSNGLVISQMYGLSTAQTDDNTTIAGLQDNGTKAILNDTWEDVMGGDGMKCLIDFTNIQTQYGCSQYGNIRRTTNGWASSVSITPPEEGNGPWVTEYTLDPNNNNVLYVGRNSLWRSENKGNTYENIGGYGSLKSIAIAPSNSNIIYIASSSSMRKSNNRGETWSIITNNLPAGSNGINDISVKHNDNTTLWVALGSYSSDGVYETTDGGQTWINISAGLPEIPVNAIIQNKFESAETQLYAGTDFGVYIKKGTDDWVLFGTEMPKTVVSELDIYYDNAIPNNSMLRASTYGRGLWEIPLELSGNFVPNLVTLEVINISETEATASGEIINTYGFDITESGIIIGTEPNPNIEGTGVYIFPTSPTITNGTFNLDVNSLQSGTRYYCRAYAINENGVAYGNEIMFNTNCSINLTVNHTENFENSGLMPMCWTEEVYIDHNSNWLFGDLPIYHPYAGEHCAYVDGNTTEDDKTMLIMPLSDYSSFENLHISFWHIQAPTFSTFQDELRVLYKNEINTEWTEIAHYASAVNEWTYKSLNLPNLSSTYSIAFEANEKMGRGIAIDNVIINQGVNIQKVNNKHIKITPNPSNGIFNISLKNQESINSYLSLNITDITGKQVENYNNNKQNNQIELNLSNLKKGVYFVNLIFKQKTYTQKLILK